jgi:hypothetical protein
MLVQLWMWQKSQQKKQQKIRWVKWHPPQSSISSTNQEHQSRAATSSSNQHLINQHRTTPYRSDKSLLGSASWQPFTNKSANHSKEYW